MCGYHCRKWALEILNCVFCRNLGWKTLVLSQALLSETFTTSASASLAVTHAGYLHFINIDKCKIQNICLQRKSKRISRRWQCEQALPEPSFSCHLSWASPSCLSCQSWGHRSCYLCCSLVVWWSVGTVAVAEERLHWRRAALSLQGREGGWTTWRVGGENYTQTCEGEDELFKIRRVKDIQTFHASGCCRDLRWTVLHAALLLFHQHGEQTRAGTNKHKRTYT